MTKNTSNSVTPEEYRYTMKEAKLPHDHGKYHRHAHDAAYLDKWVESQLEFAQKKKKFDAIASSSLRAFEAQQQVYAVCFKELSEQCDIYNASISRLLKEVWAKSVSTYGSLLRGFRLCPETTLPRRSTALPLLLIVVSSSCLPIYRRAFSPLYVRVSTGSWQRPARHSSSSSSLPKRAMQRR